MMEYIIHFLQLNILLLLSILIWRCGLRDRVSANYQRIYLLAIFPLILMSYLPIFNYSFIEATVQPIKTTLEEIQIESTVGQAGIEWLGTNWWMAIYLMVSGIMLIKLSYKLYLIQRLKRESDDLQDYYLLPMSFQAYSFFSDIFIGDQIAESDRETILSHERVHQRKLHSLDIILFELIEIIFWFIPPVFLYKKALKEVHEYQADAVAKNLSDRYIEVLLKQALNTPELRLAHSFNNQHLKKRIMKIKRNKRNPFQKPILLTAGLACFAMIIFHHSLRSNPNQTDHLTEHIAVIGDEKQAEYPGGQEALIQFLIENINYPKGAEGSGTVYVQFVINAEGKCSSFKVLRSFNATCSKAAVSALEKMPNWKPATKDGKNVKSKMTIPIKFQPEKSMNKGFQNSPNLFQQELETKG